MANSASLQLFDLIASMSRSEKRYFKIHIRTHASKHEQEYVRLFMLVEQQESYNEDEVLAEIEKDGPSQRFAVLKHRLFEKILDALESYQRSTDDRLRLRHEINRAHVLLNRGMTRAGVSMLAKVEEQALSLNAFETALAARELRTEQEEVKASDKNIAVSTEDMLGQIASLHQLGSIRTELSKQLRMHGRDAVELKSAVQSLEPAILELLANKDLSIKGRYLSNHALATIAFARNEIEDSLGHLRLCQGLLAENDFLSKELQTAESDLWANETYCHLRLNDIEAARVSLGKLLATDLDEFRPHLRTDLSSDILQSLLFYLNQTSDKELEQELATLLATYEENRWDHQPLVRAGIDYGSGLYYHSCGDTGRALRSLNKVINDGEVRRDEDIYHRTLVLITLLHAESGDRSWMVHSARALKRYLAPRNLLHGVDQLLLNYISDLRRSKTPEGERRVLGRFRNELERLQKEVDHRLSFEHFDFLAWANSRLEADNNPSLVA